MTSLDQQARYYQTVAEAIRFIRAHARQQPSLDEIAEAVHLSKFHLQRLFSEWAGLTPKRFLQYLTKEHAKQALLDSANLLEASEAAGLSSPSRLHDLMISCESMTPGQIKQLGKNVSIHYSYALTPLGEALLGWCQRGLCYLAFVDRDREAKQQELFALWPAAHYQQDPEQGQQLADQIFVRQPEPGKLHLLLRGTNFQIKVWEALMKLQPGQLCSYSQLAALAGSPKAQRAVGSAMAANTLAYLIPCHRVIRESGDSGNYRWGDERKLALQAWEAAQQNYPP